MAWRMGLPMLQLVVRSDWVPSSKPEAKEWGAWSPRYESVAAVMVVVNWVMVSLFLLSVSGLMKKR